MLKRLLCQIFHHRVNRRKVWDDDFNFRTNCERCGVPLLRDHRRWREFDGARDYNVQRQAHPRSLEPTSE